MKKRFFVIAMALFVMVGLTTLGWAAQNVANPSQKGSLLIFPKVEVSDYRDTIIEINNDFYKDVDVKCYWVNEDQEIEDFEFTITKNQPVWFSARTGSGMSSVKAVNVPPFVGERGELKCWAINAAGNQQISFNHLYGNATIFDYYTYQAFEYNSWNFTARGVALNRSVGEPGEILLTGEDGAYDACPEFLVTDFVAKGGFFPLDDYLRRFAFGLETDLTLVPCKQDLRQDRIPTVTKAKYDIWNEDEVKYTGAYQCFKCWFEGVLSSPDSGKFYGQEKFTYDALHTAKGRLRIKGVASSVCTGFPVASQATPLLGVSSKLFYGYVANNEPTMDSEDGYHFFKGGSNLNTAGFDGTGFILYDPQPLVIPESPPRR